MNAATQRTAHFRPCSDAPNGGQAWCVMEPGESFRPDMGQISTARLVIHITVPSILETLSRDAKASVPR